MDEKIIELLAAQCEDGITLLQQSHGNRLRYIVSGVLHDTQDADEVLNDVYLQIWSKFEQYSPEKGSFISWAVTIARNTARNRLRRQEAPSSELDEHMMAAAQSPEDELLRQELRERLAKAIQTLSLKEQKLFYRKYYYLQSTAQIAAELGLTERSVEGRLYRIRKKLQKLLGGERG